MWTPTDGPGFEYLRVRFRNVGLNASGWVIGVNGGTPFHLHYRIGTDRTYAVRELEIVDVLYAPHRLTLKSDGQGNWTDANGLPLPALDGCIDVDLTVTPFTNTLPIRRLTFQADESHDIRLVYIYAPELRVEVDEQRYTLLSISNGESVYRFQSGDFVRDITVDVDGLVIDYPGLFTRVWSGSEDR